MLTPQTSGKEVKKWRYKPRTLPAGKSGTVNASALEMGTSNAGVTGVAYGISAETKVKRY